VKNGKTTLFVFIKQAVNDGVEDEVISNMISARNERMKSDGRMIYDFALDPFFFPPDENEKYEKHEREQEQKNVK
jgi:hypothetical protein